MLKFGTRYYDPGIQRWTQQDPKRGNIKDPMSLNLYLYAKADPINHTDPSSRSSCATAIVALVITAIATVATLVAAFFAPPAGLLLGFVVSQGIAFGLASTAFSVGMTVEEC